jgi:hypothetical protein
MKTSLIVIVPFEIKNPDYSQIAGRANFLSGGNRWLSAPDGCANPVSTTCADHCGDRARLTVRQIPNRGCFPRQARIACCRLI